MEFKAKVTVPHDLDPDTVTRGVVRLIADGIDEGRISTHIRNVESDVRSYLNSSSRECKLWVELTKEVELTFSAAGFLMLTGTKTFNY